LKLAIFALSAGAKALAQELAVKTDAVVPDINTGIARSIAEYWPNVDGLVCIMSTGIVVRAIAPLLADKDRDPCVVVLDQKGRHAISLLSGHLGGGNDLARKLAALTGGTPVITTASDTLNLVPLDIWARNQELNTTKEAMTMASAILVNNGCLKIYSDFTVDSLPQGLTLVDTIEQADVIISSYLFPDKLVFHPRNMVIGTGCNRGTPWEEFIEALDNLLTDLNISPLSIRNLASIDLKNDEQGLLDFAEEQQWPIDFFGRELINTLTDIEISSAAMTAVGAIGVAEPCALLSAGWKNTTQNKTPSIHLISRKRKWQNITMAVARAPFTLSAQVLGL
jgi:cobalt-precorrin 5A hydrolase